MSGDLLQQLAAKWERERLERGGQPLGEPHVGAAGEDLGEGQLELATEHAPVDVLDHDQHEHGDDSTWMQALTLTLSPHLMGRPSCAPTRLGGTDEASTCMPRLPDDRGVDPYTSKW